MMMRVNLNEKKSISLEDIIYLNITKNRNLVQMIEFRYIFPIDIFICIYFEFDGNSRRVFSYTQFVHINATERR